MNKISQFLQNAVTVVIYFSFVGIIIFGISHAFIKHGTGHGFAALVFPPYALYRGAEGIFWHDDHAGLNWESRLNRDIRAATNLIGASAGLDSSEVFRHGQAVEEFTNHIGNYPDKKYQYIADAARVFVLYVEALKIDVRDNIIEAFSNQAAINPEKSQKTKELEEKLLSYKGMEDFVAHVNDSVGVIVEIYKGAPKENIDKSEIEKMIAGLSLGIEQENRLMRATYNEIFVKAEFSR